MCNRESFAKIRDAIGELQRTDAIQSEQIKTLFNSTGDLKETVREQNNHQYKLVNRLVMAIIGILCILILALVFGALGERGFNAVTKAALSVMAS